MRKGYFALLIAAIILSAPLGPFVVLPVGDAIAEPSIETRGTSHTVFAEYMTQIDCVNCPAASEDLSLISSLYDMEYVSFVLDIGIDDAEKRAVDYKFTSTPSAAFDGGYIVEPTWSEGLYENDVQSCQSRDVADIVVVPSGVFQGNGKIDVSVDITNNGDATFGGNLRVYVVEKVSRYQGYDGKNFTNAFIGYAIDSSISVDASETDRETAIWDGAAVVVEGGSDFSNVDPENIAIFAVVYGEDFVRDDRGTINPIDDLLLYYLEGFGKADIVVAEDMPEITITSPISGSTVIEIVNITASISSTLPLSTVEVKIDAGEWHDMAVDSGTYNFAWDTTALPNGNAEITVKATNNQSTQASTSVTVYVNNVGGGFSPILESIEFSPADPTDKEEITVTAIIDVRDAVVSLVELYVRVNEGPYDLPIAMTKISNSEYGATIGPFNAGDDIGCNVTVTHDKGDPILLERYFTVISSAIPVIESIEFDPADPVDGEEITISATIKANDAIISSVEVTVCIDGTSCGFPIIMASDGGDVYSASIGDYDEGEIHCEINVMHDMGGAVTFDAYLNISASAAGEDESSSTMGAITGETIFGFVMLLFLAIVAILFLVIIKRRR